MKTILLFATAFVFLSSYAQETASHITKPITVNPVTEKYATGGIVLMNTMSKELMMEAAYKWLTEVKYAHTLGSKGIVLDEAVFNKITVNQYLITSEETKESKIRFVWTLEFKDGRFRYYITDFFYYHNAGRTAFEDYKLSVPLESKLLGRLAKETNNYFKITIEELITFIVNYKPDNSW